MPYFCSCEFSQTNFFQDLHWICNKLQICNINLWSTMKMGDFRNSFFKYTISKMNSWNLLLMFVGMAVTTKHPLLHTLLFLLTMEYILFKGGEMALLSKCISQHGQQWGIAMWLCSDQRTHFWNVSPGNVAVFLQSFLLSAAWNRGGTAELEQLSGTARQQPCPYGCHAEKMKCMCPCEQSTRHWLTGHRHQREKNWIFLIKSLLFWVLWLSGEIN